MIDRAVAACDAQQLLVGHSVSGYELLSMHAVCLRNAMMRKIFVFGVPYNNSNIPDALA